MTYTVHIQYEAQKDIQNAFDWYEEQLPGLGKMFLQELYTTLGKIAASPENYGFTFNDFRDASLKKFPYVIVFKIAGKKVYINSVRHTKRLPKL